MSENVFLESSTELEGRDIPRDTREANSLAGAGETGKVVRSMDWTKTPLGPIESWPRSLRTTVSLCLASNFPISLAWGPEHVQIYNDGYWPICGKKHPAASQGRLRPFAGRSSRDATIAELERAARRCLRRGSASLGFRDFGGFHHTIFSCRAG